LFDLLGMVCPSKSALQYTVKKLGAVFWQRIIRITSTQSRILAIDSTGFSTTNPSYHYLRRIDGKIPRVFAKLSASLDVKTKKFCDAYARIKPAHDVKDAKALLKNTNTALGDKSYNSEELYEHSFDNNILLMSPKKKGVHRGFYRKKQQKQYREKTYNKRQLIEAGFSSIKRKYGYSVSSKKATTIRAEIYSKLACHNLIGRLNRLSGQSRCLI